MKKQSIFLALATAVTMLGFTSCEDDKEPVYHTPTVFELNTPPFAQQTYELREGGVMEFTCSQPNYGYAATATYSLELSLSEEFTTDDEGTPNYYTIKGGNLARISVKDADLSKAICNLMGITGYSQFPSDGVGPVPVYIRAYAEISGIADSGIHSNTIKLDGVTPYNPYPQVGRTIYIVGSMTGWGVDTATPESYAQWGIQETGVGTDIYVGAFNIPAGDQYFRFYTELGDWGAAGSLPSIGATAGDGENTEIAFTDDAVVHPAVPGLGNWCTAATWEGGFVTFTINMKDESAITVTMQKGNWDTSKLDFIYLVGACSAWDVDKENAAEIYADYKLYDWNSDGVYSNTFDVAKGAACFRFYTELGKWGEEGALPSIGAAATDTNVDLTFTGGVYAGPCFEGKGNWNFTDWEGGKMKMTVDIANMAVKFEAVTE